MGINVHNLKQYAATTKYKQKTLGFLPPPLYILLTPSSCFKVMKTQFFQRQQRKPPCLLSFLALLKTFERKDKNHRTAVRVLLKKSHSRRLWSPSQARATEAIQFRQHKSPMGVLNREFSELSRDNIVKLVSVPKILKIRNISI